MKCGSFCLAVLASALVSPLANAAQQADLKVRGFILPPACNIGFEAGGIVDYEELKLPKVGVTAPASREIKLNINCESPTRAAFTVTDNKSGTVSEEVLSSRLAGGSVKENWFGLGLADEKKIGGYLLHFKGQTSDGDGKRFIEIMSSSDGGGAWTPIAAGVVAPGENTLLSGRLDDESEPKAYQTQTLSFMVSSVIAPASSLDVKKRIDLDGLSTFTLHYL